MTYWSQNQKAKILKGSKNSLRPLAWGNCGWRVRQYGWLGNRGCRGTDGRAVERKMRRNISVRKNHDIQYVVVVRQGLLVVNCNVMAVRWRAAYSLIVNEGCGYGSVNCKAEVERPGHIVEDSNPRSWSANYQETKYSFTIGHYLWMGSWRGSRSQRSICCLVHI